MNKVERVPVLCGAYVQFWIDVSIKDKDLEEYFDCLEVYEDMKNAGMNEAKAFLDSGLGKFLEDRCSQDRARRARKILQDGTEEMLVFDGDYICDWVFFREQE